MNYNKVMVQSATGQHMLEIIEYLLLIADEDKLKRNKGLKSAAQDIIDFSDNTKIKRYKY